MPQRVEEILTVPLPEGGLSRAQYREFMRVIEAWEKQVRANVTAYPAQAYELGVEQTIAFLNMVGEAGQADLPPTGPPGTPLSKCLAVEWLERYTLGEIDGALSKYLDEVRSGVLYGLQGGANPTQVASWLYKATGDATVNWRTLARTEMVRANAAGRLDAIATMGYTHVWSPRHAGACNSCRRLLEGQVFPIEQVRNATNYGRKNPRDWVACIPLHPQCRHSWLAYISDVFEEAQQEYQALEDNGLDDKTLDEMFESSGQVKPQYANDPRLAAFFEQAGKTVDPLEFVLGRAITKSARKQEPPGLHHTSNKAKRCATCRFDHGRVCSRYDWKIDDDEVCRDWELDEVLRDGDIGKGYFDNPQNGLDPLLWTDEERLKPAVRDQVVAWWRHTLGPDAPLWSRLYLTGSACSRAYAGRRAPHDLDVHVLLDAPAFRQAHPEYGALSDPEIHAALTTQVRASLTDVEAAPGLPLDAYLRSEITPAQLQAVIRTFGGAAWDVQGARWLVEPAVVPIAEAVEPDGMIFEGEGAQAAREHPEWLAQARRLADAMSGALADGELAELRDAYDYVHQLRDTGQHALGQFLWQYLLTYGPLLRVKHLLHDTPMAKVYPDYTIEVEKGAIYPRTYGLSCPHCGTRNTYPTKYGGTKVTQGLALPLEPTSHKCLGCKKNYSAHFTGTGYSYGTRAPRGKADSTVQPLKRAIHKLGPNDVDVAKDAPAAAGTEHWITVHPHGEDEKGIPVLIRENGDGTARVIGGAGGHLDFLRISHQGRMKEGATPKDRGEAAQAGSEEEAATQRAQQEQAAEKARDIKDRAQGELKQSQGRVEDLVRDLVDQQGVMVAGEQARWADLSDQHRKELVKQAVNDSLYQSSYGQAHDLRRSQAPAGPIVVTPAPKGKDDDTGEPTASSWEDGDPTSDDGDEKPASKPVTRLRIAMPTEHADLLQEEVSGASLLRKRVREANKVIGGEAKPTDATNLDWQPLDKPAAAQRRAAEIARQEVNRALLGELDQAQGKTDAKKGRRGSLIDDAVKGGAFDAYDSLTYSVFGKTLLPTGVQRLLGVNGTAQLLAHELQTRAANGEINLKQLQDTIDEITDERQQKMLDLDLNRARAASREAAAMGEEYAAGAKGESLFTRTAAKSRQAKKIKEAASSLGMAIGSCESLHTLRALMRQPIENVKVDGYGSPAQIKDMAAKAKVHVTDRDIVRNGAGNYSLKISPERMSGFLDVKPDRNDDLRARLEKIRTGADLDHEIEQATHPPGYSRQLDRAQAQGSMYLQAAGSGVLAFAPGVGKTDTAIGAALETMAKKPGSRALIVAPATAMAGTWAKTIQATCPGKSLQVFGLKGPDEGQEADHDWEGAKSLSGAKRKGQAATPADFNIISFDTLKKNPDLVKQLGHNIVITDEAQYAKNPGSQRLEGLDKAAEGVEHRWALTGTPQEKNRGELHTLLNWARPGAYGSRGSFTDRFEGVGQFDHLATEEKVQQFREAISDGVYHQSQNASNMPAFPEMKWEDAPLSEGHQAVYQQAVNGYNDQWQERHDMAMERKRQKAAGTPVDDGELPSLPAFGGRDAQIAALMKPHQRGYHGPNSRVTKVADLIGQNPEVNFDGFKDHRTHVDGAHAGTYAPKSIVFGRETQPLMPLKDELERRGTHKVFYTDGSVGDNDQRLKAFLAHKGPAVLITSDKNKTARSLQFGDNSGSFQHGATQVIHTDIPQNNADLQQRVARAWRRGAQAPVSHHAIYSDTPVERQARDQLASELRSQSAIGNPEDKVSGRETIGQKLRASGQKRLGRRKDAPANPTAGNDGTDDESEPAV